MPYVCDANGNVSSFGGEPSSAAYANAALHKYPLFANVTGAGALIDTIKQCVYAFTPVLMAFLVFRNIEQPNVTSTGHMAYPSPDDLAAGPIGGHEVVVVGWDDNSLEIEILNSWGASWGDKGFLWMSQNYLNGSYQGGPFVPQLLTLQPIQFPPQPAPQPVPPKPQPTPVPPGPQPAPDQLQQARALALAIKKKSDKLNALLNTM